jgi:hypothetical protein
MQNNTCTEANNNNKAVRLLWKQAVHTDTEVRVYRPNTITKKVLADKMAIPVDRNAVQKEAEKKELKYKSLCTYRDTTNVVH